MGVRGPSLEERIAHIKQEIAELGTDLSPGILTRQYNVCGRADCRCKADPPRRHGPYYQLSYTRQGQSTSQFVKKEDLPLVRKQVRAYRKLKRLVDRWIALGMQLSRHRLQQQRQLRADSGPKKLGKSQITP